jgi:hypothetical protein
MPTNDLEAIEAEANAHEIEYVEKMHGAVQQYRDMIAEIRELRSELARLRFNDNAWPFADVLGKLLEAADILLIRHSYDGDGYELIQAAVSRGHQILSKLTAVSPVPPQPAETPVEKPSEPAIPDPKFVREARSKRFDYLNEKPPSGEVVTRCRKCKCFGHDLPRSKYCGDGSDKDNSHDWQTIMVVRESADEITRLRTQLADIERATVERAAQRLEEMAAEAKCRANKLGANFAGGEAWDRHYILMEAAAEIRRLLPAQPETKPD